MLKDHEKCRDCAENVHEAAAIVYMTEEKWNEARDRLRLALASLEEVRCSPS
jgi:hypothetical protein